MRKWVLKNKNGVALVMTLGIMSVIVIMAIAMSINLKIDEKAAANYQASVQASLAARAGVQRAIAEIKEQAKLDAFYNFNGATISEDLETNKVSFTVTITDCNTLVNINDEPVGLENLLKGFDEVYTIGFFDISEIAGITSSGIFYTKEDVKNVAGIGPGVYGDIKNYITAYSYQDDSVDAGPRSPININLASRDMIASVLWGVTNDVADARNVADDLIVATPISQWSDFDNVIDSNAVLTTAEKTDIKQNANPNRSKTAGYSTEFCFHPGGVYEINVEAIVKDNAGNILARNNVQTAIEVLKIWNQTAKEDFRGEDADYDGVLDAGEDVNGNGILDVSYWAKTNFLDSCPVNSANDLGLSYSDPYDTVGDSVKIGHWDDFEDSNYTFYHFDAAVDPNTGAPSPLNNYVVMNRPGDTDPDLELVPASDSTVGVGHFWPNTKFKDVSRFDFEDYSLRIWNEDDLLEYSQFAFRHTGWVILRQNGLSLPDNVSVSEIHGGGLIWDDDSIFFYYFDDPSVWAWDNFAGTINGITIAADPFDPIAGAGKYAFGIFYPELVSLPMPGAFGDDIRTNPVGTNDYVVGAGGLTALGADPCNNIGAPPDWGWTSQKTYHCLIKGTSLTAQADNTNGQQYSISRNDLVAPTNPVNIKLYGDKTYSIWDDLRVIPDEGYYYSTIFDAEAPVEVAEVFWTSNHDFASTTDVDIDMLVAASDVYSTTDGKLDSADWSDTKYNPDAVLGMTNEGRYIQYKAILESIYNSASNEYEKTPVMEDVTVVYIPRKSSVLFWRENAD